MPQVIESRATGGPGLKNTENRIEVTVYVDGVAAAASDSPTFTITRADGTALVTDQAASTSGTGVYYYDLTPAQSSRVDTLTVELTGTWSGAECTFSHSVEIRGAHLFTVAEARSFDSSDGSTGSLNSATVYPTSRILQEREYLTDLLEQWTGVSWVPRHYRGTLGGSGSAVLKLPHYKVTDLIAADNDGTTVTVSDVTIDQNPGVLRHETGVWAAARAGNPRNVTVEYEHGHDLAHGVTRIALLLLRDRLVKSAIPDGAISAAGEFGNITFVQPGGPYMNVSRVPEVNAWVAANAWRPPVA